MIAVKQHGNLYVPLYYKKPNETAVRFQIEDCKIGKKYYFPLYGDVEKFYYIVSKLQELQNELKKGEPGLNEVWGVIKDDIISKYGFDSVNIIALSGDGVYSISLSDSKDFIFRFMSGIPNTVICRSAHLNIEHSFLGAMNVLNDVSKAIVVANDLHAGLSYKGNYAIIDLDKYFATGEMCYTKT